MKPGNNGKIIPLLDRRASREQMVNAINENTLKIDMIIGILEKLSFIAEELQKRVMAAEGKEGDHANDT